MKAFLLPFFFFFSFSLAYSQIEFAPPGATWHYTSSEYAFGAGLLYSGYEKWTYDRDSLFMGKDCKILTGQLVKQIDGIVEMGSLPERIIYQDSFKIYSWYKDRFFKMYDFGLAEGDTVTLAGGNNYTDYCSATFQADSVYYETINGVNLKNIILKTLPGNYASYSHINEKFGALPDFLFVADLACILDLPRPFPFRCYEDNDFPLYQADTTSCEHYDDVSTVTKLEELGMSIHPNPIRNYFEIKNKELVSYDFSIHNNSGQLVYQSLGEHTFQRTIDVGNWNAGVYFILVKTGNRWAYKQLLKLP